MNGKPKKWQISPFKWFIHLKLPFTNTLKNQLDETVKVEDLLVVRNNKKNLIHKWISSSTTKMECTEWIKDRSLTFLFFFSFFFVQRLSFFFIFWNILYWTVNNHSYKLPIVISFLYFVDWVFHLNNVWFLYFMSLWLCIFYHLTFYFIFKMCYFLLPFRYSEIDVLVKIDVYIYIFFKKLF